MTNPTRNLTDDTQPAAASERDALDAWLAAGRDAVTAPPAWLEAQLMARLQERRALQAVRQSTSAPQSTPSTPRWPRVLGWLALPTAAMAALLVGSVLLRPLPPVAPESSPFLALAPLETIAAERGALLVPAHVPRAQLAEYGMPIDPARADEPARAEFLMSRHGVVLAVRFVQ